jgi:hypothetical protein
MLARLVRPFRTCVPALLAALALAGGCAGGGGASVRTSLDGDGRPMSVPSGQAVQGDVLVVMRTYQPGHPTATMALVNESSERGRKLQSGRASSTEVRVVTDEQMGTLLAALDQQGFGAHAQPGVTLESVPDDPRRRGVLLVEHNGQTRGILFGTDRFGTRESKAPVPTVYTDCKRLVWALHSSVPGYAVSASTNPADVERLFSAPRIKLRK